MPFLTWNKNLSVGVISLDTQHKRLIDLVNQLHDAMAGGQGKTVLQSLLDRLVNYTVTHFTEEEQYMERTKYADLAAHKVEHQRLTRTVLNFKQRYDGDQTMLTLEVMTFLKNWLISHIQGNDRKYTPRQAVKAGT